MKVLVIVMAAYQRLENVVLFNVLIGKNGTTLEPVQRPVVLV